MMNYDNNNNNCCYYFRRSIKRGESVKYLIPDPVIDYIKKHNLYQVINYSSHIIVYYGDIFS